MATTDLPFAGATIEGMGNAFTQSRALYNQVPHHQWIESFHDNIWRGDPVLSQSPGPCHSIIDIFLMHQRQSAHPMRTRIYKSKYRGRGTNGLACQTVDLPPK
ncbi:hypothetical protein ACRALDRAFT_209870 [Sodiomyces alcalophilus JCM 7366]|uniref:uncharacterized protein n=1 Tax=Sodiomyces alcalophilus JCM 7366 TaxID=591952 RepID=UPI0039B6B8BF